jgi:hypothetical protein
MQFTLPEMLKQSPKQFWGLLNNKAHAQAELQLSKF